MAKNKTSVHAHLKELVSTLDRLYPSPRSELNFADEYQLIVSVILSAQCTDKKVNEVTPALFGKFPDFPALARAKIQDVEKIIRPVNFFKTKSKNIVAMADAVCKEFAGTVPRTHEGLISLAGVGNKTANVVLSELAITPTFPVDTHVFRVSKRLGLTQGNNVEKVEEELKAIFKPALWRPMHHWLILHGRRICKAPRPLCEQCPLAAGICEQVGVKKR